MFAFRRGRFPLLVPLALAVAFGYLLAGGIGSVLGALLFLPILIMKVVFMMFFFGFLFKMFAHRSGFAPHHDGRRGHGWHPGRGWGGPSESRSGSDAGPAAEPEDRDWEEALRAAKREIDKLFPNPGDGGDEDHDGEDRER